MLSMHEVTICTPVMMECTTISDILIVPAATELGKSWFPFRSAWAVPDSISMRSHGGLLAFLLLGKSISCVGNISGGTHPFNLNGFGVPFLV